MKVSEIVRFADALAAVKKLELKTPWPWAISRNLQKVRPIIEVFLEQKSAFMERHAKRDDGGKFLDPVVLIDPVEGAEAWAAIIQLDEEIAPYKLKFAELKKVEFFPAEILDGLTPMIDDPLPADLEEAPK